jgi:hypothetical protein
MLRAHHRSSLLTALAFASSLWHGCGSEASSPNAWTPEQICQLVESCHPTQPGATLDLGVEYCLALMQSYQQAASTASDLAGARAEFACEMAARSCSDLAACAAAPSTADPVCEGTTETVWRCDGNRLIRCASGKAEALVADCGSVGLICGQAETDAACGIASCDPSSTPDRCDGTLRVKCDPNAHVLRTDDCVEYPLSKGTCFIDGQARASCRGQDEPCNNASFVPSCDGSLVVTCRNGNVERDDCAALRPDLICGKQSEFDTLCTIAQPTCNEDSPGSCDNGVVAYCSFGKTVHFDCRTIGMTNCAPASAAAAHAHCSP